MPVRRTDRYATTSPLPSLAFPGNGCVSSCEFRVSQVHEGKSVYATLTGNIAAGVPSPPGQLSLTFRAFHENRLPFFVRVLNPQAPAVGRLIATERPQRSGMAVAVPVTACLDVYLPDVTGADVEGDSCEIFQRANVQQASPTGCSVFAMSHFSLLLLYEYITHSNTFYIRCIVGTPTSALCDEFLSSFTNYSSRKWTRIIWCNYLSQGGYVFIVVCLSVSRITQKLYSTDCHKIRWKKPLWSLMVIWITLRYGWGQGKFMIMVRWGRDRARNTASVLQGFV